MSDPMKSTDTETLAEDEHEEHVERYEEAGLEEGDKPVPKWYIAVAIALGILLADQGLDLFQARRRQRARVWVAGEQRRGDAVDPRIGGLRREDRRDEQLVGIAVVQLRVRAGVLPVEPRDDASADRGRLAGAKAGHRGTLQVPRVPQVPWVPRVPSVHQVPWVPIRQAR